MSGSTCNNPTQRMWELQQECLDSFKGYSPQYGIPPHVYASAGISWLRVANLVGCIHCQFRILWCRFPGQSDGYLAEELLREHAKESKLSRCEWARLNAGVNPDSQAVKDAEKEWDKTHRFDDWDNWYTNVWRLELTFLYRAQLDLDAIMSNLLVNFTGNLEDTSPPVTLTPYDLRDLKRVSEMLERATKALTFNCNTGNVCEIEYDDCI